MKTVIIRSGIFEFEAELYHTSTAEIIYNELPFEGEATLWGGEIYFTIPIDADPETEEREILNPGELGYWTVGNAFCIFFGTTPASTGNSPQAYSPVNVFGKIKNDISNLYKIQEGDPIFVEVKY
jgi:uncharacterized protein